MPDIFAALIHGITQGPKIAELVPWPTINRAEAYAVYAAALGRSAESLTEAERQTAFVDHVLRQDKP